MPTTHTHRQAVLAMLLLAGAASPRSLRASSVVVFQDDFENGNTNGWTMEDDGDTNRVVDGNWEIDEPIGTIDTGNGGEQAQPGVCASGTGCAFTGQNDGGSVSTHDVDNGTVWLRSPIINLAGAQSAVLEYCRWYYWRPTTGPDPDDYFRVSICSTAPCANQVSSKWTIFENLGPTGGYNNWECVSIPLHELGIPLTETMQIRYAARDAPAHGAFLEAAVDDVRIIATFKVDGDLDGDGDVDLADFSRFLACMGADLGGGCQSADIDGSGEVDLADFAQFFAALEGPG